jgi:hypothetical protein
MPRWTGADACALAEGPDSDASALSNLIVSTNGIFSRSPISQLLKAVEFPRPTRATPIRDNWPPPWKSCCQLPGLLPGARWNL